MEPALPLPPPPPPPAQLQNDGFAVLSRGRSVRTPQGPSAPTSAPVSASATPPSTFSQPGKMQTQGQMWQQRVFIGNMQRFCLVEISSGTSAGDVLNMVDGQGALDQTPGSGGWMLWEVSQDFGMG